MVDVVLWELIMLLVIEKFEQRRVLRSVCIFIELLMEDFESCFSCSGNMWIVEDIIEDKRNVFWCL